MAQLPVVRADRSHVSDSTEIAPGDLVVEYDPIVEVMTGRIVGADIVAPFVKLREIPTASWRLVLLNALVTSVRWHQRGLVRRSFITALPLGVTQLDDPTIERAIRASLAGSGANPESLHLILDDEVLLHADQDRIEQLVELTSTGVRLAVVGLNACAHVARHRHELRVSLLRIPVVEFNQPSSPNLLERAAALELELVATGVDEESAFIDASRHGSLLSVGTFHRSQPDFSDVYETLALVT